MAFGDRFKDWFGWGDDVTYEDDPYGIGESLAYDDIFDAGDDSYTDLSLDDLLNLDYGDDAGLGSLFGDYTDDPWGIGEGYGDAFDFSDDDNNAFNKLLMGFDFDDPDADWAGGIGDLFGTNIDSDDPYGIGRGMQEFDWYDPSSTDTVSDFLASLNYGADEEDQGGIFSGKRMPKAANFFNSLFGGAKDVGSKLESGIGGLLDSNLGKLLLANYLTKKDEGPAGVVPVGAGAFSAVGGGGDGSPIDYRVFNLQPALMPGVAYANVGSNEPEGMKGGGLGDVTLARLEPGEFVVTKKAVDNIGAKNLYKMMREAEGRG